MGFKPSLRSLLLSACPVLAIASLCSAQVTLTSPNGQVSTTFSIGAGGQLQYNLTRAGQTVLENSQLGLIVDGVNLGTNVLSLSSSTPQSYHTSYAVVGNKTTATNDYREITLNLSRNGTGDSAAQMIIRAYDTGLAYQYLVPGSGTRTIGGESTSFNLPSASTIYANGYHPAYEGRIFTSAIGSLTKNAQAPMSVRLPNGGGWAAITEANLSNYHGMSLQVNSGSTTVQSLFPNAANSIAGGRWEVSGTASWSVNGGSASPWRVVMAGANLNSIVNNDIVTDVNPAPSQSQFQDTSYIKPGRALWSWWSDSQSPKNFNTQKQYVDYATQLGFEYVLVDEGWTSWNASSGETLSNLVQYAKSGGRDVGIWVWSGASINPSNDYSGLRSFLDKAKNAGCVGVKLDFIEKESSPDSQANSLFYKRALELAAERGLMVNFHGASKPVGEARTYPNEMTREGVRGMENGNDFPDNHAGTPFTRGLAGPVDFTPTTFQATQLPSDQWGHRYIQYTTFAHQLALPGVLTSPVVHYADNPQNYLSLPAQALDMFKSIPTVWDETVVLDISDPGKLAAIARRSGAQWFLFMINGDRSDKTLSDIDLSFLGDDLYDASLIFDQTKSSFRFESPLVIDGSYDLDVALLSGGGFVGRFTAVPEPAGLAMLGMAGAMLLRRRAR